MNQEKNLALTRKIQKWGWEIVLKGKAIERKLNNR